MRKALVVGINYYPHLSPLYGCVDDAHAVKAVLERHGDGAVNFGVRILTGTGPTDIVSKGELKDRIAELFAGNSEVALFYFAGHGHVNGGGGCIVASDSTRGDDGVMLDVILGFAKESKASNRVIILDSCHSGAAGTPVAVGDAVLREGTTILTASTKEQYASEEDDRGVFTTLLVDALNGSASDLCGEITPGSIYAHIDQSLGSWDQRPVFKTNVQTFVSLRRVQPRVPMEDLRRIVEFFPIPGAEFKLDPSFEPEAKGRDEGMPPPDPENTRTLPSSRSSTGSTWWFRSAQTTCGTQRWAASPAG